MVVKRRQFMAGFAAGLAGGIGIAGEGSRIWKPLPRRKDGVETLGSARNLIFVLLTGGPSHVDTFDMKTGSYTPTGLGVQNMGGGVVWPAATMPKLGEMLDQFTMVRSVTAVEAVHERAVYHLLTAHRQNAGLMADIPHFASILSFKLDAQRRPSDSLPTVMMIGENPAKNGFLPLDHLGLELSPEGDVPNLEHVFEREADRFGLLNQLLQASGNFRDRRKNQILFQDQARAMMLDPDLKDLLGAPGEDGEFDIATAFRRQCETAVRVIAADKGTRVFQLELNGWDHHVGIYNPTAEFGLFSLSRAFDEGFSYLIDALSALPAQGGTSGSLLDQTLIVALGEFGRTTGNLNTSGGRDHYPYANSAVFAGGGVKPGRIIGGTNGDGSTIIDPGWSRNRYMGINDVAATIYSALGVDWTERFENTPSGRTFQIIDTSLFGPAYAIDSLFV